VRLLTNSPHNGRAGPERLSSCREAWWRGPLAPVRLLTNSPHNGLAPVRLLAILILSLVPASAQASQPDQFHVYTDAPRLFLRPQRLRLLRRERDRQSARWTQLETLIAGGAQMKEPGFAEALVFATTGDKSAARRALRNASDVAGDARQAAFVIDWCRDALSGDERQALAKRLAAVLTSDSATDIAAVRNRVLAAIATADYDPAATARTLQRVVADWWRGQTAPALRSGDRTLTYAELYPFFEILHAIRDNLNIDLREDAPEYFKDLPLWYLTGFYPAPYASAASEYRIPCWTVQEKPGTGEPDLTGAALARAAGLALVASDTNGIEAQYVQSFLMQDRLMMRETLGAPYEFLWANPYQPGLAYALLPPEFYDARDGALFLRSSWDDDARWFGIVGHELQLFDNGHVHVLELRPTGGEPRPLELGAAEVVQARVPMHFQAEANTLFVVGLKPGAGYDVEVEDEEMQEFTADRAGTLRLDLPKDRASAVYLSGAPR
jgi:hypothetical protein